MRKALKIALIAAAGLLLGAGGFAAGRLTAPPPENMTVLLGEIQEVSGSTLLIKGSDQNDINRRGEYRIELSDDTPVIWRHTKIDGGELKAGHRIFVYYDGVFESHPARFGKVFRIELLNDEI